MLIVKNLKKTYKTKGGVEVKALDDVLDFNVLNIVMIIVGAVVITV